MSYDFESHLPEDLDVTQLYRIQFYSLIMVDGDVRSAWYSATTCRGLYQNSENWDRLKGEFNSDNWICPDVKNITVHNNPELYRDGDGQSFFMVVNNCTDAVNIDQKYGLSTYADTVCAS